MKQKIFFAIIVVSLSLGMFGFIGEVSANTKPSTLAKGIQMGQYKTQGSQVTHISVDLRDSYAKVKIGLPAQYGSRMTTTKLATSHSKEGHRVVGAINAGFFHMNNGYPAYLIAHDNHIYSGSYVVPRSDEYVNQPTAFGVNANGEALVDYYKTNHTLTTPENTFQIQAVNRPRMMDEIVVYTPTYYLNRTGANEYGEEFIVETSAPVTETKFGQSITGKITKIAGHSDPGNSVIPKNGFVISAHGTERAKVSHLKVGSEVTVNFGIEPKWQDAEFILATGPMLVTDGKRNLNISTSSWRARQVTARSAVGISKEGKVHFVTVDATSTSKGMNLMQFADYLVSLGLERAINLDGGGSTTMAYRPYGWNDLTLANRPMGAERAVSTILEAVNIAPPGQPQMIDYTVPQEDLTLLKGQGSAIKVNYVLDEYYNPVDVSGVQLQATSDHVSTSQLTYKAEKEGKTTINVKHGDYILSSFQVNVVETPTKMTVSPSNATLNKNGKQTFHVELFGDKGEKLRYSPSDIQWTITEGLGTISNGVWTASGEEGKSGTIRAQVGNKTIDIPIKIAKPAFHNFKDIPSDYMYETELKYLLENGYMKGYPSNEFKPDQSISREHAALILVKVLELDTSTVRDPGFVDVPKNHIYYKEIAALANEGIISGRKDNNGHLRYFPHESIKRSQMAKNFVNSFNLEGISERQFQDVPSNYWAYNEIQALVASGIATGYNATTFKPEQPISRIHFGRFLYKASLR